MNKLIYVLLVVLFVSCSGATQKPVSLIIDTDMAPDYDDVGALALAHTLADSGYVNILAVGASNRAETAAACIDVINTYFDRGDIPVGAVKDSTAPNLTTWHKGLRWTDELPKKYPHKVSGNSAAEDAVSLYRKILSSQPDTSVVIVTIGFMSNMKNLLLSQPDSYSDLNGQELVAKKVKRLVSMAGMFPSGKEFNLDRDAQAAKKVFQDWPTAIVISGFDIGEAILTGKRVAADVVENSPVKDAYEMCLVQDNPQGRHSWDQTAVLVAIRGAEPYFAIEQGVMTMTDDSLNHWQANQTGKHARLIKKMPTEQVTQIIEDLMIAKPLNKSK